MLENGAENNWSIIDSSDTIEDPSIDSNNRFLCYTGKNMIFYDINMLHFERESNKQKS